MLHSETYGTVSSVCGICKPECHLTLSDQCGFIEEFIFLRNCCKICSEFQTLDNKYYVLQIGIPVVNKEFLSLSLGHDIAGT